MKVKSESEVTQLCPTLSDPMDCSLPGSSVHGIFQARVLEWGAIAFSVCIAIRVHVQLLSHAWLFRPPRLWACQAPPSTELSRQGYWSGLLFPTSGDLPDPGIKSKSPALAGGFFTTMPVLGWPKSSFRFLHNILGKNQNKLFSQPYRPWIPSRYCYYVLLPAAVPNHTPNGGGGLW